MTLETDARKEFARILTKVTRIFNAVLDGRAWGGVKPDDIRTAYITPKIVCMEGTINDTQLTMHASYDTAAVSACAAARKAQGYAIITKTLPQEGRPGYVIIAPDITETASERSA